MDSLSARVRKHRGGHYFSVFAGTQHVVSGETRGGTVEFYAPRAEVDINALTSIVGAECERVDADFAERAKRKADRAAKPEVTTHKPIARSSKKGA